MRMDKETLLGLCLRSALASSVFVPWTELVSGRLFPWWAVFVALFVLAALAHRVGAKSHVLGMRVVYATGVVLGVGLALVLRLTPFFFLGTVIFSGAIGWTAANASFEPIDPFRVRGAAVSGIWSFILLGILMLVLHRPSAATMAPDFLLFVLVTGATLIFARASHLRYRSRAAGTGASSTFLNTGLRFLLLAFLPAFALGILAAPSVVANFLGNILSGLFIFLFDHLAPLLETLVAEGQRVLGPLMKVLYSRKLNHTAKQPKGHSLSMAEIHAIATHSRALLTALLILIILTAMVSALALLGRLIQSPAAKHDIFEEERETFTGSPPAGPGLPGTLMMGWPYSRAESSLRRAIRSILRQAKGEGQGPHPFETLREWQRRQADRSSEQAGLFSAYEAHRYGGAPEPPGVPGGEPPDNDKKPE